MPPATPRLRPNWFLVALAAVCLLAWLFPALGAKGGALRTEVTTKAAIFLIFLIQGLLLRTETLASGLRAWRVHIFIQGAIFLAIPLSAWALLSLPFVNPDPALRIGFLFLAILPTTISTASAFSAQAGGNVTIAIFNTCFANVFGVVFVPIVAAWISRGAGTPMPILPVLAEIGLVLALPLLLGQLLRPGTREAIERGKVRLSNSVSALILFIVFAAVANSVASDAWAGRSAFTALWAILGAVLFLALNTGLVAGGLRLAGFAREDSISALFCGSQKTLAAGIPIAQSVFAQSHFAVGLIVLPLMAYHIAQIVLGAILVGRFQRHSS